jgi:CheY-like chemotaxis protein
MQNQNQDKNKFTGNILLLEDNEEDIIITQRTFKNIDNFDGNLFFVKDAHEALDFLNNSNDFKNKENYPKPDLILIDINLPKMKGSAFLQKIKSDNILKYIPCIILSSSNNEQDVKEAYSAGAAGYIMKPISFSKFKEIMQIFIDYWSINESYEQR